MHCWGEGASIDVILNEQYLHSSQLSLSAKQQGHCDHSKGQYCPHLPFHMASETGLTRGCANLLKQSLLPTCTACASAKPCAEMMSIKYMKRGLLLPACSRNWHQLPVARPYRTSVSVSLSPIWPRART